MLVACGLPVSATGASRRAMLVSAALLQETSLGFLVVVSQIGLELELISEGSAAALIAAGLLSVIIFPLSALTILQEDSGSYGRARAERRLTRPGRREVGVVRGQWRS